MAFPHEQPAPATALATTRTAPSRRTFVLIGVWLLWSFGALWATDPQRGLIAQLCARILP